MRSLKTWMKKYKKVRKIMGKHFKIWHSPCGSPYNDTDYLYFADGNRNMQATFFTCPVKARYSFF